MEAQYGGEREGGKRTFHLFVSIRNINWHIEPTTGPVLAAAATAAGWRSSPNSPTPDVGHRRTRSSRQDDGTVTSLRPLPSAAAAANRPLALADWMPRRSTRACSAGMNVPAGDVARPRNGEEARSAVSPVISSDGNGLTSEGTAPAQRVCRAAASLTVYGRSRGAEMVPGGRAVAAAAAAVAAAAAAAAAQPPQPPPPPSAANASPTRLQWRRRPSVGPAPTAVATAAVAASSLLPPCHAAAAAAAQHDHGAMRQHVNRRPRWRPIPPEWDVRGAYCGEERFPAFRPRELPPPHGLVPPARRRPVHGRRGPARAQRRHPP